MGRPVILVALTALVAGLAGAAEAAPLNIPVPTNATITHNGLVWAWAAPCNPIEPSCGVIDLSFQGAFGWHIPTAAEFLLAPLAPDFVFPGANVPLGGVSPNGAWFSDSHLVPGDTACAAPFFSTTHSHCDWKNAPGNGQFGSMPWGGHTSGQPPSLLRT